MWPGKLRDALPGGDNRLCTPCGRSCAACSPPPLGRPIATRSLPISTPPAGSIWSSPRRVRPRRRRSRRRGRIELRSFAVGNGPASQHSTCRATRPTTFLMTTTAKRRKSQQPSPEAGAGIENGRSFGPPTFARPFVWEVFDFMRRVIGKRGLTAATRSGSGLTDRYSGGSNDARRRRFPRHRVEVPRNAVLHAVADPSTGRVWTTFRVTIRLPHATAVSQQGTSPNRVMAAYSGSPRSH